MELTIDQALQKAIGAHKAGQIQEADRLYTAILKVQPKHPDANHNLGVLSVGVGKTIEALPLLKTALEASPSIAQFWLSYIDALIKLGRFAEAKAMCARAKSAGAEGTSFDELEKKLRENHADTAFNQALETNLQSSFDAAVQLRETGKFHQAIDLLKDEINQYPGDVDLLALLSHCCILADQLDAAKLYLDQAKKIAPYNASVGWNTARLALKENKNQEALGVAKSMSQTFPDDVEGMAVLAACLRANEKFVDSLKVLNQAIKLKPDYAEALITRGLIFLNQGKKANAIDDLELAHKLKPHIKPIWDLVIGLKLEVQAYADAIHLLINMIAIDPDDEKPLSVLTACVEKANDSNLAVKSFERVLEVRPGIASVHLNLGVALAYIGDTDSAFTNFRKALSIQPSFAKACYHMGILFQTQGKLENAIEFYNQALSIEPDYAEAHNNLGNALQEQGKLEDAMNAFNQALSIKPDYAGAYNNLGNALQGQGKLEDAMNAYSQALSIKPDYAEAYNNLGNALQGQGKLEDAMNAYSEALSIKPNYAVAYNNLGNTFKIQGKLENAIEAYNQAILIDPDYDDAAENAQALLVQLLPIIGNYRYNDGTGEAQINDKINLRPKYQIQNAIKAYLENDFRMTRLQIKKFRANEQIVLDALTPINKNFCYAYCNFIEKLLDDNWDEKYAPKKRVYHLGESHCLSYAHRSINIGSSIYRVVPRITFGAKAFHFSQNEQNTFKSITKAHFLSLPKNSKVFLSYGEIDCRPNEGFITAARKLDKTLEELIDVTTEYYVKWFLHQNADQGHQLYFMNVPAPIYRDEYSYDVNSEVANAVALFNAALRKLSRQYNFEIVDLFKFTTGNEGFSNGLFHLDPIHLGAKAICEIERQLS